MSHRPEPVRRPRSSDRRHRAYLLAALFLCAAAPPQAGVPAGGSYSMSKEVIAAGGGASSGGSYQLVGSVGQGVIGPTGAGATHVYQGFHAGAARPDEIFHDGFE